MPGIVLESVKRTFRLGNRNLSDPSPNMTPEKVRAFYQTSYPELANAAIHGPTLEGKSNVYTSRSRLGRRVRDERCSPIQTASWCSSTYTNS